MDLCIQGIDHAQGARLHFGFQDAQLESKKLAELVKRYCVYCPLCPDGMCATAAMPSGPVALTAEDDDQDYEEEDSEEEDVDSEEENVDSEDDGDDVRDELMALHDDDDDPSIPGTPKPANCICFICICK
jgi:hypothetical protein